MENRKFITVIAEDIKIEGRIFSPYSTFVNGEALGEIISKGKLVIGKEGKVKGNIKASSARIEGRLTGNLITSGEVEISSAGTFTGNLITKSSVINTEKGGVFKGHIINVENEEIFEIKENEIIADLNIKVKKIA